LVGLAERFGLPEPPRRIEVYDNSHISGTSAVGAMIVAGPEGFVKKEYRKFNIKAEGLAPGDDYAMMREVLTRRFKRLQGVRPSGSDTDDKEVGVRPRGSDPKTDQAEQAIGPAGSETESEPGSDTDHAFPSRPDLVLIDGGASQLKVATEVLAELGLSDIPLAGVAKGPDRDAGREHFHVPGRPLPFMLESRDPVLYFVQRLRDEAHRFVIGTHRAKRSKALGANPLDEIDGIGPTRKRALLHHFGSAKAVSRAGIEDLKHVEGISAELAQKIYAHFHERAG
jgi:excinuclease ABC subunit C